MAHRMLVEDGILAATIGGSAAAVRCYEVGSAVYSSLTREFPGDYALWKFVPASEDGVYRIKNLGVDRFVVADDGKLIVAENGYTEFRVQPDEDDYILLKLKDGEKVWAVTGQNIKDEAYFAIDKVFLEGASGSVGQQFIQKAVYIDTSDPDL
ncbi:hypothetical protein AURDEDRAFT_173438 [Auricularia subglabra TFB-10046 SS5]|nr:hypothetical protein AURDEDRAFT_173438 [Auricularia subglabra TFB-10046 SS5]